jgi:hypothetical protein
MCQVCAVAIIGGLGLSRWLHVDDTVSGVWIGAFILVVIYYTIAFFRARKIKFWGRDFLTALSYYALIFIPLYTGKIIGHPLNRLWGVDKLIVGAFTGTIVFIIGAILYNWMKKKNGGHAHFPMEKVAIPIASLLIVSAGFYFLTK